MKKILLFICFFIALVTLVFLWWQQNISPVNPTNKDAVIFVIPKGQGIKQTAKDLQKEELIRNEFAFLLLAKQLGLDTKIQAGDFKLSPSMSAKQISEVLTHGSLDVWITIPEGMRADEIADILSEKIPSYKPEWRKTLENEEGYLFPDTYLIPKQTTITQIIQTFESNFDAKIGTLGLTRSNSKLKKIIIVASLLEREAKTADEKPIIAGIIQNRLDIGMALQIDATIQYAKGRVGNTWWSSVDPYEYKSVKSIYNTYLFPGLPPGPIANPGLTSIQAAQNPANTDYFFYLHDKNGNIHFARTGKEHEANIQRYY